jgi:hypothetical protein
MQLHGCKLVAPCLPFGFTQDIFKSRVWTSLDDALSAMSAARIVSRICDPG